MIPVKNEQFTIEEKLKNISQLLYPKNKLQIIVIDSNSDDTTIEIIQKLDYENVEIYSVPHKGKAYAMKQWIDLYARWEIVISTDANAYFAPDVIHKIVQHFADPTVGWVSWAMVQVDESHTQESQGSGIYWKIEKYMRTYESRFHSCICMNGEITCVRKTAVEWKDWYFQGDPDDFDLSLFLVKSWYRIIYEPQAHVWEKAPDSISDIEKQKVRIIVQTLSAFTHYFQVLFVKRYGFILFSHKFLALTSPLILLGIYVTNIFLLEQNMFLILFIVQNILYMSAVLRIKFSVLKITNFLIFLNYLILKSYFVFLSGRDFTKWDKIMSSRK